MPTEVSGVFHSGSAIVAFKRERTLTLISDVIHDPALYWLLFTGVFVTFNGLELKFHPFTGHPRASGGSADIF